jgi:hypothetical protein
MTPNGPGSPGRRISSPRHADLGPEEAAEWNAKIEQAEADIAELKKAVHVNFRWTVAQLELVKRAAALHGVPYQTYLKEATVRQALADLKAAVDAGVRR